jgi:hypothetical protein
MDSPISIIEEHPYGRRRLGTKEQALGATLVLEKNGARAFIGLNVQIKINYDHEPLNF